MNVGRNKAIAILAAALGLLPAASALAASAKPKGAPTKGPSAALSRHPIKASGAWRSYVADDLSPAIYPKSVEVLDNAPQPIPPGTLDNPEGLLGADGNPATINATIQGSPAVILDLGRLTGGTVQVGITASDGATLRLAYS
jgi:hypothetical protein